MGRKILLAAAVIVLTAILTAALDNRMVVRNYEIEAEGISAPIRMALVTDLHSCYYGKDQKLLVDAIHVQKPDIILMSGDIFDDVLADTNTRKFLAGIAGRYPCYYVIGNHECRVGAEEFWKKMAVLQQYGVTVLANESQTVTINGTTFNICGVEDPEVYKIKFDKETDPQGYETARAGRYAAFEQQLDAVQAQTETDNFTILLAHRPELFESYAARDFDLVLCGHAHGGQWRIPGVLNGLFAPNQGLFPKYAGGRYDKDGTTMIVSRGLAKETTIVPRIFNPPELVVITLK